MPEPPAVPDSPAASDPTPGPNGSSRTHGRLPTLDELETVHLAAQRGSVGAAARALRITQQAASHRIRAAERRLGLALFDRSTQGVSVTPDGTAVIAWIGDVLHAVENLAAGVDSLVDNGTASVATSMTIAEYVLPAWVMTLRARRPELRISVTTRNSADVIAAVENGDVELGFVESPDIPADIESEPFARDELVLVVAPAHPWARRDAVDADEVRAVPLVLREPGSGTRRTLELALPGLAPPLIELGTTAAVKAAVHAGTSATVLSRLAVRRDLEDGRLVAVTVSGTDLTRDLRVVRKAGRTLGPAARELLAIARGADAPA